MAAVLGVDLGKAEYLGVGQRTAVLFLYLVQVGYLLGRQRQAFLLVVFLQIVHVLDGLRLYVDGEDVLCQTVVHALQHGVVLGFLCGYGEVFLNTLDAAQAHVLGNLDGVGRPGGHHLAARADIMAAEHFVTLEFCVAEKPAKFLNFLLGERVVHLRGYHALLRGLEKENHSLYTLLIINLTAKVLKFYRLLCQRYLKFSKSMQLFVIVCV